MLFLSILHSLDNIDRCLTLMINGWNNSFFDHFFYVFTQTWVWIPLAVLLVVLLWRQWGFRSLYFISAIVLVIILSDQFSSSVIKPIVERPRPTHDPDISYVIHFVNGYRGGAYGFVSSHAANSVAFVVLTSLFFKRKLYTLFFSLWAFLTAYSRIYLGVHYLGDVLCGALVGILSAYLVFYLFRQISKNKVTSKYTFNIEPLSVSSNILMVCALLFTIGVIMISCCAINIL